ncbi:porin [Capnocytophaga leadbetteri]|uniref:porin n=1 Tax=Capnocytophaga leadbetteri TaxID=327575 RepID=UPI0026F0F094|nr:porin [Capnocytophaga leadbetteri]
MKKLVFTAAALMSLGYGYAQDSTVPMATLTPAQPIEPTQKVEEKVEIKSVGRIHFDGGVLGANNYHNEFVSGIALADFRAGLMMRYGQWKSKIEMGYANQALSVKDVFIEYDFNKHTLLRGGYFLHQFGMQSVFGASAKISMEEPLSNSAFYNSRLLGVMLQHQKDKFFGTLSLFAENEAIKQNTEKTGSQGMGMMSRLLYRLHREEGNIFHIGISGAFETPRYNKEATLNHSSYILKTYFPTRIARVAAQEATINNATFLYKFSPELLVAKGRWGLEAQYYYLNANRKSGFEAFDASGAYAMVRTIIKGKPYAYADADAVMATPKAGAMELVAGYNYTDLSNSKAGILGGRLNDYSLTFNYYINKYMIWRVRTSYTSVGYRADKENTNLGLIETRLQIKF